MSRELVYLLLIFGLLVIPRALQRFNIPAPITCLAFGLAAMLGLGDKVHDPVIALMSMLGISSLFLFAGLEVDVRVLRQHLKPLIVHLLIRLFNLVWVGYVGWRFFGLGWQAAALLALALLTPSTGFILDTLERLGLSEHERFWVTNKAIAGELLALVALFFVLLAGDPLLLAVSSAEMLALMTLLPLLYLALGRWVVPHAPGSEFSLLVMVGFVAAYVTYKLGVYYLVGAFIAGLVARLLHVRLPKMASDTNIHALRLFATFFVPFYFFHAGTQISREALSLKALALGLLLTLGMVPLRIGMEWLQRRVLFPQEQKQSTFRVSLAMTPTLVFTLVLAEIMHARFGVSGVLAGALVLYTTLNTLLPSFVLRAPFDVADAGAEQAPVAELPVENAQTGPTSPV